MTISLPAALVSTEWLARHLWQDGLVVLDASFKLPGVTPTAAEDFRVRHIEGARFFDIDQIADHSTQLPHMLPGEAAFEAFMAELGVSNASAVVVVYDTLGLMSAGRAWWTLQAFGHRNVAVLDGGLKKWLLEGRPVTDGISPAPDAVFTAKFDARFVRSKRQLLDNLQSHAEQVIDARSAARFAALEKEARPGLRSGHIPGSLNLPFTELTDAETGALRDADALKAAFDKAGLNFESPVVATCGSGVTAAALTFALHVLGKTDVAVYDGAWAEWGLPGDTPVIEGPADGKE